MHCLRPELLTFQFETDFNNPKNPGIQLSYEFLAVATAVGGNVLNF